MRSLQMTSETPKAVMEKCIPILLVEDDRDEAALIRENLEDASHVVQIIESGEEAIAYLSGEGKYSDRSQYPLPFLVLLDLKMPGVGGFGVLRWLSGQPDLLAKLNVMVLSATQSLKEIEVAHELGAQFFLPKSECSRLVEEVQRFENIVA